MLTLNSFGGTRRSGSLASNWPLLAALAIGLALALLPPLPALSVFIPILGVLIFVEPLVGIALMLIAGPWGALESIALGGGLLDSGQILFFVTVAAWLAHGALKKRIMFQAPRFALPLLIFIGVGTVTLLSAISHRAGIIELVKWIEIGVVAIVVVDRAQALERKAFSGPFKFMFEDGAWRFMLFIILVASTSQALIGIWQFGLRNSGPEHFAILGGHFYRAYGTFEQPNPFGGFMAWIAVLAIGALLGEIVHWNKHRRLHARRFGWLIFLCLAGATATLALVFSWSRGAWLGFASGLGAALFLWPRKRSAGASLFFGMLLAILLIWQSGLLPPAVAERVGGFTADLRFGDVRGADINDANYSVLERLAHWQAALEMAKYNLWSGVGIGNYEAAYGEYALINWPYALGHAHNYYLNIFAETGVLGLLAYLALWLAILWQTLAVINHSDWPIRGVALGLLAVWVSLSVHHLLDKLYVNNLYLFLGAMLGVLQILYALPRRKV